MLESPPQLEKPPQSLLVQQVAPAFQVFEQHLPALVYHDPLQHVPPVLSPQVPFDLHS
jgi:hypothetical protein